MSNVESTVVYQTRRIPHLHMLPNPYAASLPRPISMFETMLPVLQNPLLIMTISPLDTPVNTTLPYYVVLSRTNTSTYIFILLPSN